MSAVRTVEKALRDHGCSGSRGTWTCPAHEDRSPSLAVKAGDDGRALVHCHAGCQTADVLAVLGLQVRDLFDGSPPADWRPAPKPAHGLTWAPPKPHRGRIGLPTWDDAFWSQPEETIDAHFAGLDAQPGTPTDGELRAFLADLEARERRLG